ncbi:FAD-dependent oxidoreductase [Sulfolobales archaeon HS-7]|nr:FAD-dependent oxidoreductase [Sulfolobales archaeon HS-7]
MVTVILGGGFAGVSAKLRCRECVLVDKSDYFINTSKLVDVVEGKNPEYCKIKRRADIQAEVISVNYRERKIVISEGQLHYDKLIVALGYVQDVSRIKGAEKFGYRLSTMEEAMKLRELNRKDKTAVIIGGGSLGVELAGVWKGKVKIVEGGKGLVSFLGSEVSKYAEKKLTESGGEVIVDAQVEEVKERELVTSQGTIPYDVLIITIGISPSPLIKNSGFQNKGGRMLVDKYLRSIDDENVFGVGDCAVGNDYFWPMSAQIALQSGEIAAQNIMGKNIEFTPKQEAVVLRIGQEYFGTFRGKFVQGKTASLLKHLAIINSNFRASLSNFTQLTAPVT